MLFSFFYYFFMHFIIIENIVAAKSIYVRRYMYAAIAFTSYRVLFAPFPHSFICFCFCGSPTRARIFRRRRRSPAENDGTSYSPATTGPIWSSSSVLHCNTSSSFSGDDGATGEIWSPISLVHRSPL